MDKRIVETVNEKISSCTRCKNNCPCKVLSEYINNIGIDEFYRQLENDTVPEHIKEIFNQKREKLNI